MTYFFGYGVYRDKQRLKEILEKEPRGGYGAILPDYILAIQKLSLIPEKPRSIIEAVWGDKLRAYTLRSGQGFVAGVIWELEDKDIEILKKWEYDGIWREFKSVGVSTYDNHVLSAITEMALDHMSISQIVDGLNYDNNLNKHGKRVVDDVDYKIAETRRQLEKLSTFGSK